MSTKIIDHFIGLRRVITHLATATFAPLGLATSQVGLLRELERVGRASQATVARTLAHDPAALVRSLDALESRGWVRREASATDRRQKEVSLTDEGRRAVARVNEAYAELTARVDAALTPAERKTYVALTDKLIAALSPEQPIAAEVVS
jgi:DNA-binding MarR family transcriptional regulator